MNTPPTARPSPEPDWEHAPLFGRRETLIATLRHLYTLNHHPACIVETGTLRNDSPSGCSGDGWSTLAWGWYCQQVGGIAYTVDISADALEVCKRLTVPYAAHLQYVCADSVAFLHQWVLRKKGAIQLLYLDSLDYIDYAASEAHCLAEAEAALPSLAAHSLVLFDDTWPTDAPGEEGVPPLIGKGKQAVPFLVSQGFRLEWCQGNQVLLSRGAGPS